MKPIGQLDTSHAMYQPSKRASRRFTRMERQQIAAALLVPLISRKGIAVPNAHGSREEREAWMRERQSRIGSEREKLRLPNPPRNIQQRWIDEGEK